MNKFKVGDVVKGVKDSIYACTDEQMEEGKVIKVINDDKIKVKISKHATRSCIGEEFSVMSKYFELIRPKKITKDELLKMPIGTKITTDAEEEFRRVLVKSGEKHFENEECSLGDYSINEDLSLSDREFGTRIVKIEEPEYKTVYDYSKEVQEMTIAEIEKELGHSIKIIKEEK